jgi:hypothetical protein
MEKIVWESYRLKELEELKELAATRPTKVTAMRDPKGGRCETHIYQASTDPCYPSRDCH